MKALVTHILEAEDGTKGIIPKYMTSGAAAADVATPLPVDIPPHTVTKIPIYLSFDIPEGYCIKFYPRSSLMVKRNLMQPVSIIDSDYHGMCHVPVYNFGDKYVQLEAGERIAQIKLEQLANLPDDWDFENAERDQNGFGGTGRV